MTRLFSVAATALISGCYAGAMGPAFTLQPVEANKGMVYVYRPYEYLGRGGYANLFVNGEKKFPVTHEGLIEGDSVPIDLAFPKEIGFGALPRQDPRTTTAQTIRRRVKKAKLTRFATVVGAVKSRWLIESLVAVFAMPVIVRAYGTQTF